MTPEEARLALRRHATSKVRVLEDLFDLHTMGFRGEALPSIASVSRMTMTTRRKSAAAPLQPSEAIAGTRLEIEAGVVIDESEVGAPVGTQIEIRDLLYNVPARLKFLKGDPTESSHITDAVNKLAMANPSVHFRLRRGSRSTIDAPMHADGFERARALLGARLGRRLHRVEGQEAGIRVLAYLAAPELAMTTSRGLQMFVGRRPVRDRGLLHAVRMGYGELLPKGRYPVAVLFVDAPLGSVDVNVHPQKMEVRFSDAQVVFAAVRHVLGRGISAAPWLDEAPPDIAAVRMHAIAQVSPTRRPRTPGTRASDMATRYAAQQNRSLFTPRRQAELAVAPLPVAPEGSAPGNLSDPGRAYTPPLERPPTPVAHRAEEAPVSQPRDPEQAVGFFSRLRYLGQLDKTYLVCEADGEMVLVDQHAAHERVEFQRLRERHRDRSVPVQRLLFPETLELPEQQAAAAIEVRDELAAVGFEVEPFGGNTLAIKAVPAGLRHEGGAAVLSELLAALVESGGSAAVDERLDAVFATIACHSVVRAGDVLSAREVEALLGSLDAVDFRAHCPHGRPVLLRISIPEIARRFGRT
jgi:DNA mismatch repair protein MutL